MIQADPELELLSAEAPAIDGLQFRRLRLPEDVRPLVEMHLRAAAADDIDERESAEDWERWFRNPWGFDPMRDAVIGEVDGHVVAFGQARALDDNDGARNYTAGGEVDPEWRFRGIGRAILRHNVRHQRERARREAATEADGAARARRLEATAAESAAPRVRLLQSEGFVAVRWFFEMLRPTLDHIVDMSMPEGLEIRPVEENDYRTIWAADQEAFRDHWGAQPEGDVGFDLFFKGADFRPDLWRVAWDDDQVAGVVMNRILTAFNEETGERRGELAGVSVRRPWRRRGLARALVSASLRALRDEGMTSAVLGVDAENPTGALGVYESNGFAVHRRGMNFRRPLFD